MRNMDYYLSLNYHKRLYQDEVGDWIVEVDDLPGCIADGKTPDEAIGNLRHAMTSWITSRIEAGLEVPEPSGVEEYSGRILLRMPRFLHRRLSLQAKVEGVSLNQYLVSLLVDASARVNLVGQVVVQNVSNSPLRCSWEGVPGVYLSNLSFGEPNLPYAQNWVNQEVQYLQGGSPSLGRVTPKLLPAFPMPRENA